MIILCGYFSLVLERLEEETIYKSKAILITIPLLNGPSFYKVVVQFYMLDRFGILK